MDELDNAVSIDEYCYSHDIDDYDLYGQIMEGDNDDRVVLKVLKKRKQIIWQI